MGFLEPVMDLEQGGGGHWAWMWLLLASGLSLMPRGALVRAGTTEPSHLETRWLWFHTLPVCHRLLAAPRGGSGYLWARQLFLLAESQSRENGAAVSP